MKFLPCLMASVALWSLTSRSVSAQALPSLAASLASNQTVVITWPYTNAGFVLQEANGMEAPADWEASAISPGFDSNTMSFLATAPITNPAGFFRLLMPSDLRGIYVDSNALPLSTNADDALAASFGVPGVDGVVLVLSWRDVETNLNQFDWSELNWWMGKAVAANLKVDISVRAGDKTPMWLFKSQGKGGAGATPLTFSYAPKDGGSSNCDVETIAAPWDTNFLAAWDGMLANLAENLKTNGTYDAVKLLRLTGINRDTDELHLPSQTTNSTGLACVSNAPEIWWTNGYRPSTLLQGWDAITTSFKTHFPDKSFSVAIIALTNVNPFPPIDEGGNILTNVVPGQNQPLLALASQKFRGRLVIQNNSLHVDQAARPQTIQSAQSLGTLIAFQTNEDGPGMSADCNGTCDDASYLAMLQRGIYPLEMTNSLRAQYIEVFALDANAFTNAIWVAHQELFTPP